MRIAACGQTSAHRPHWMQTSGSQIGISKAMLRFSTRAVSVGNVPSTGKALTGNRSPRPAISIAVTRWTNSEPSEETGGSRCRWLSAATGTWTWFMPSSDASTAAKFFRNTDSPRLPYVLRMASLMRSIASSRGNTPESAKKHVCMTVLIRDPIPAWRATSNASTTWNSSRLSMICCCTSRGKCPHT